MMFFKKRKKVGRKFPREKTEENMGLKKNKRRRCKTSRGQRGPVLGARRPAEVTPGFTPADASARDEPNDHVV